MKNAEDIRIVVISSPVGRPDEADEIHALFEAGMTRFHLRKPSWNADQLKSLTDQIDCKWHPHISIHVNEQALKWQNWLGSWHGPDEQSSSIHSLKEYHKLNPQSEYCLIGPLFDSISKEGYRGNPALQQKTASNDVLRIAIGGITHENAHRAIEWGYDGVALLGSIWQKNDPVDNFLLVERSIQTEIA